MREHQEDRGGVVRAVGWLAGWYGKEKYGKEKEKKRNRKGRKGAKRVKGDGGERQQFRRG
jgi:hypothetical protein